MELAKIELDAHLEVPRDVGSNIKALWNDPQYRLARDFIRDVLCRRNRLSFVPGNSEAAELMVWFEGRRFVGESLQRIANTPMEEQTPPEPPARTMTERVRRQTKNSPPKG